MANAGSGGGESGARTRKSPRLPRLHPLWGLGLALASALVLVYGIWLQPPGYHPFDPNPSWLRWFLNPQPPKELRELTWRPLAAPAAGWAPRALPTASSEPTAPVVWLSDAALQARPASRSAALVIWAGRSATSGGPGILGADGAGYLPGRTPLLPVSSGEWVESSVLRGHEDSVFSAVFSPDGARVLTASRDNTARLGDAASGQELRVLRGHEASVRSAVFPPDGARVLTASFDSTARLWDAASGQELRVLRGHENSVYSAVFSPDGARVLTASEDNTARLWDAASGQELRVLRGHEDRVLSAVFSPDGARVLTASFDNTARLWDAASGQELHVLRGHENPVSSAVFSPDGARVLTASFDSTARLWDAASGQELRVLRGHENSVYSAVFSPDGARVLTASFDNTARLWDAASGQELRVLRGHENPVNSAVFSPDGARVLTASADSTARLWSEGVGPTAWAAAFLPSGRLCASDEGIALHCPDGTTEADDAAEALISSLREHATGGPWARITLTPQQEDQNQKQVIQENVQQQAQQQQQSQQAQQAQQGQQQQPDQPSLPQQQERKLIISLPEPLPANVAWHDMAFLDAAHLLVVGAPGLVLRSANADGKSGAATFTALRMRPGGDETLTGLLIDERGEGWIAGYRPASFGAAAAVAESLLMPWRLRETWAAFQGVPQRLELFVLHNPDPKADAAEAVDGGWSELRGDPAPWVFVAGPPLLLLIGFLGAGAVRGGLVEREGIAGAPSSDRPIDWSDRDALKLKPIALALSRFLRNEATQPPITVAVTGGWGTGKSSLMNLLRTDLRRYGARPVWFNAWHHRDETHLLAALLENVRTQAIPPWYTWPAMGFRARLLLRRLQPAMAGAVALAFFALVFVTVADLALDGRLASAARNLLAFEPPTEAARAPEAPSPAKPDGAKSGWLQWLDSASLGQRLTAWGLDASTGLGGLGLLGLGLFLRGKLRALPADPAQLLSNLSARATIADFRDKLSFRHQFAGQFDDVCRALRTRRQPGLVIIIDDLDRCQPDAVLQVLEAVNYLVAAGPCFVVLGVDRGQIEHAVGLGFKDIVEGLPDQELQHLRALPKDADETERKSAKRRAYARYYLEKLFNIEVAVPRLEADAAVRMLVVDETQPQDEPPWLPGLKSAGSFAVNVARVASLAVLASLLAALLLEPLVDRAAPVTAPTAVESDRPSAEVSPIAGSTGAGAPIGDAATPSADSVFAKDFRLPAWSVPSEIVPRWGWYGAAGLALLFGLLFLLLEWARRERSVERDSPAFAVALKATIPAVHAVNPTPRAVKLYENRMRYLAARLEVDANPRRPDFVDRCLRLLGRAIRRPVVPEAWFERRPPALDENQLLLLGAVESVAPQSLTPAEWKRLIELDESARGRRLSDQIARSIGPLRILIENLDFADQRITPAELDAFRELRQTSWNEREGGSPG